ncbi:MAG: glycosyltransferase [Nitrosopumilaceae archaeon]|nr:glycosyltransferase family 4 protein [Nitrosopumilaceae archaeon]NIU88466.1 glycosyltransferase [Nitrosopumilaceae archaeon]NIX62671.1 glycosyltransferase [Nitrosopumilaceae archaeon]
MTIHEKYFLKDNEGDLKILSQIPDSIDVLRTRCFFIERFLGLLNRKVLKKKKIKFQISNSDILKSSTKERPKHKSKTQKLKDSVTDLLSFPDKYVGWIPFATWSGIKFLRKKPVDVIYAVGKPWTGFFVGYVLKLLFRKPLVIDFMDPWIASTWRPSKASLLEKLQSFLEKFIVTHSDFLIANTNELAQDFVERLNVPEKKVDVLTCGYDDADFAYDFFDKSNHSFTITHTGSFYRRRNPKNFLKAVKILLDKGLILPDKVVINFIGSMSINDAGLNELFDDPLLKKIIHQESWVPHKQAIEYLWQSDVLLVVQPGTYLQIPAKLYEYVALQKPIIALAEENGAVGNIIRREGWGETINNDNIEKIGDVLHNYYKEYISGNLNKNKQKYNIEAYNVKNLAKKLGNIFQRLSQQ